MSKVRILQLYGATVEDEHVERREASEAPGNPDRFEHLIATDDEADARVNEDIRVSFGRTRLRQDHGTNRCCGERAEETLGRPHGRVSSGRFSTLSKCQRPTGSVRPRTYSASPGRSLGKTSAGSAPARVAAWIRGSLVTSGVPSERVRASSLLATFTVSPSTVYSRRRSSPM